MGIVAPLIRFELAAWEPRVSDDLRLMRDVTERDLAIYQASVVSGAFKLFRVLADESFAGWVIWSIDHEPDGFTLVCNAAAVLPVAGADVAVAIFDAFEVMGRETGARALRFWTTRPGLRRKMEKRGFLTRFEMELEL